MGTDLDFISLVGVIGVDKIVVARTELLDVFCHYGTCVFWEENLKMKTIYIVLISGQTTIF